MSRSATPRSARDRFQIFRLILADPAFCSRRKSHRGPGSGREDFSANVTKVGLVKSGVARHRGDRSPGEPPGTGVFRRIRRCPAATTSLGRVRPSHHQGPLSWNRDRSLLAPPLPERLLDRGDLARLLRVTRESRRGARRRRAPVRPGVARSGPVGRTTIPDPGRPARRRSPAGRDRARSRWPRGAAGRETGAASTTPSKPCLTSRYRRPSADPGRRKSRPGRGRGPRTSRMSAPGSRTRQAPSRRN
jgi:hypothetical protein